MKLYNTETRKIEEFIPWNNNKVSMYTCGPTVYSYAHIGNLRTYIMEDILEKTLRMLGYDVTRVMNITDVGHLSSDADTGEDKMVKSAKKENKSVLDIARFYTEAFFKDIYKLNIKKPDIVSPATENIDEYIKIISKLLEVGYAYSAGGNIYFDTSKLDNYYRLTNHVGEELISGVRETVEEDENKKNKTDFVLWFTKSKFEDQELKWDSPFGKGYPGWHIECTGISLKNLGEYLDIHCGGVDNIFPHHTNEIAQSEAFLGHKWCNYWMHAGHLNDKDGKMSKSKGEFLTVCLLEKKGYDPLVYRYFCLGSHYRNNLEFSYEALDGAKTAYNKLKNKIKQLDRTPDLRDKKIDFYKDKFKDAISNDLNTSSMLTLIYDVLKDEELSDFTKLYLIEDFDKVLSLSLIEEEKSIDEKLEKEILEKIELRNQAKKDRDYQKADLIRNQLLDMGIRLIDGKDKTTYEII